MSPMHTTQNRIPSINCPDGFVASGIPCGIKPSGNDDLALIQCPGGANAAAMFTTNQFCAAPIQISRSHLRSSSGRVRAILINSGCANAATGDDGRRRAINVVNELAARLQCPPDEILVNSTGMIGTPLPDDRIIAALPESINACSVAGLHCAAMAIMTTDTKVKIAQRSVRADGRACSVVGIAKGAGMIHPNMATMIAIILTDAHASPKQLRRHLRDAVDRRFHRITVDGDTSTNDAVFALASGAAGAFPQPLIAQAIDQVASDLTYQIVCDGEGATKCIRIRVINARTPRDATTIARTIASSLLVRTGLTSDEPNWGRILAAVGRSGVAIAPDRISVRINDSVVFAGGVAKNDHSALIQTTKVNDEIVIEVDVGAGNARDEYLTCDLTEQYVRINADYST